jgi:hypothetical protein
MHGIRCMTQPPEVRAELANLRVPAADYERPLMPMSGWLPVFHHDRGSSVATDAHLARLHTAICGNRPALPVSRSLLIFNSEGYVGM